MPHRQTSRSATILPPVRRALLVTALLGSTLARADVEWHADLDTARAAARISHRPVLAVFMASWSGDPNAFERTCLASPEAEAVLAACFEPVRIDIDAHPGLTRAARVTHVPTACVLAADDTPLASFEMPDSPTAFVTAAVLAAQRAVTAEHDMAPADGRLSAPLKAPEPANTTVVFGSAADPAPAAGRPQRGSMARVAAKVRDLSAFAVNHSLPAPAAQPVALSQAVQTVIDSGPTAPSPAWPAETVAAQPTAMAVAPSIEPAATSPAPATVAPWLDAAPVQPSAPRPAEAAAATTASATAPLPPTAPQAAPATPQSSGLIAALQKPFGLGAAPAAEPPTMPPALPRGPLAALVPAPTPPDAAGAAEGSEGSMPLGLEGYCPVTLVDRGTWTEGRAQWGARHRGRTYLFAGPDEQRTFLADPDRYAPALSGDDPVLALDRGSSTPGQRRFGVTYQSRMYLFATPETRQAFTADPGRYVGRITVAERTAPAAGTRLY